MSWLLVAIFAYFCSAIVALFDRYLLTGPIPLPKVYAFYVGILGILILFLIPFVNFLIPELWQIFLSFLAGALFIFSLLWFLKALQKFEASRVVPAIGGLTPLFVFGLTTLIGEEVFTFKTGSAFILLVFGSFFISFEGEKKITLESLQISAIAAFLFSLAFFSVKFVYFYLPFWSGFIWTRIGGFILALFFLFSKDVKEEIFKKKKTFKKKTAGIFLLGQSFGAGSVILQNWAIALAPLGVLAFINALEGTKYIFILILAILISWKFPQILKEEFSKKVLIQKIIAISLIGVGLALLTS
ncbi:hypothetical protein AMJ48_01455 [Parcubacteria bacterium DG_74_1]|nr:MAG: hypothetical protein AMJ48_01455 [Parcubacteria bacterium DG_74_1]